MLGNSSELFTIQWPCYISRQFIPTCTIFPLVISHKHILFMKTLILSSSTQLECLPGELNELIFERYLLDSCLISGDVS